MRLAHGHFGVIFACLVWVGLAACSRPFPTSDPEVVDAESGEPLGNLISFCYGTEMNKPEEIKETAAEQCEGQLVFVEQNMFFNDCPLLQIARVTYQCQPLARDEANAASSVRRP